MAWWAAAGAALGAVGSLSSLWGSNSQADEMRRQAKEEARRLKLEHDQTLGQTQALGGASGVEYGSQSLRNYITDMTAEFRREEQYNLSAGMRSAKNMQTKGWLDFALGMGQTGYDFGQANNWWKTPAKK